MNQKTERLIKLADTLRKYESYGLKVKPEKLAKESDYTLSTVKTHYSKKLKDKFVFADKKGMWSVRGMLQVSNDEFIQMMKQTDKSEIETEEKRFSKLLIKKSRDSFIVALESYNRPSLENRVEVFCILAINAWELLLKATLIINEDKNAIYRKDGKSLSISECASKLYSDNDPIRENLKVTIALRDKATHLLIPEIQHSLSRIFQSSVMNYIDAYRRLTGINPITGQNTGLLSLVIDGNDADYVVLKRQYGTDVADSVNEFIKLHSKKEKSLSSFAYSIPIDYRLTLTKSANDSDLTLGTGTTGKAAMIITKAKDPSLTHPYRFFEVIEQINQKNKSKLVTSHTLQAIFYKHKIKNKDKFHFEFKGVDTYSESFVDWVLKNNKQSEWLKSALDSYKNRNK